MGFVGQSLYTSVVTRVWHTITEQLEIRSVYLNKTNFCNSIHVQGALGEIKGYVHFDIWECIAHFLPFGLVLHVVLCIWSFSVSVFPPLAVIHFLTLSGLILCLIIQWIDGFWWMVNLVDLFLLSDFNFFSQEKIDKYLYLPSNTASVKKFGNLWEYR